MSATVSSVLVDREILERFRVEVQALARLEHLRFGGEIPGTDTPFTEHIDGIVGEFERDSGVWDLDDDAEGERLYARAGDRAREVHREILESMLDAVRGGAS